MVIILLAPRTRKIILKRHRVSAIFKEELIAPDGILTYSKDKATAESLTSI